MNTPKTNFDSQFSEAVDRIMANIPLAETTLAGALMEAHYTREELMTILELAFHIVNTPSPEEWRKFRGMIGVAIRHGVEEYVADKRRRSISY